jgi:hypothetical protein
LRVNEGDPKPQKASHNLQVGVEREREYSKKEFERKSKFQSLRMYERGITIYFREIDWEYDDFSLPTRERDKDRDREEMINLKNQIVRF